MRIEAITLFPPMFAALTDYGISRRAHEQGRWSLRCWNPRDFTHDPHRTVDDRPYGGGPGMVMMAGPLDAAIRAAQEASVAGRPEANGRPAKVLYLSPAGAVLDDAKVRALAAEPALVVLCGRYEGVDERLVRRVVDEELSIGDYVLSGGELAAMVLIDAVVRQLPGVLNDERSAAEESFAGGLLDCPHFTRPEDYQGERVPEVLLSGNHALIERWRLKQSLGRTWARRPELLAKRGLSKNEEKLLAEYRAEFRAVAGGTD